MANIQSTLKLKPSFFQSVLSETLPILLRSQETSENRSMHKSKTQPVQGLSNFANLPFVPRCNHHFQSFFNINFILSLAGDFFWIHREGPWFPVLSALSSNLIPSFFVKTPPSAVPWISTISHPGHDHIHTTSALDPLHNSSPTALPSTFPSWWQRQNLSQVMFSIIPFNHLAKKRSTRAHKRRW